MIVLDTNVISEPLKLSPAPEVVAWFDRQPRTTLYLTTVTIAELRFGVARMPSGRHRKALSDRIEIRVLPAFAGRVLDFDLAATESFAECMARAQKAGVGVGQADGFIAAIAAANGMSVATRDIRPFEAAGVAVLNPWESS